MNMEMVMNTNMNKNQEFRVKRHKIEDTTISVSRLDSDAQRTFFISFKGSTNGEIILQATIMKRTDKIPTKISDYQRIDRLNTSEKDCLSVLTI